MSRIGKAPVTLPEKVSAEVKGTTFSAKGPKGELSLAIAPEIVVNVNDGVLTVERPSDHRRLRSLHGMTRALIQNIITGVTTGFEKALEIQGVGYRATLEGKKLVLNLGYSHPVEFEKPADLDFEVSKDSRTVTVRGIDKQRVGQVAAVIRAFRPPEPYKGTGIRYVGEHIRRKEGKSGA